MNFSLQLGFPFENVLVSVSTHNWGAPGFQEARHITAFSDRVTNAKSFNQARMWQESQISSILPTCATWPTSAIANSSCCQVTSYLVLTSSATRTRPTTAQSLKAMFTHMCPHVEDLGSSSSPSYLGLSCLLKAALPTCVANNALPACRFDKSF